MTNLHLYLELIPLVFIAFFCGLFKSINHFYKFDKNQSAKISKKEIFFYTYACIFESCIIACVCFFLSYDLEFSYQVKIGIAVLVSFLGFEKSIDFIEKILRFKKG